MIRPELQPPEFAETAGEIRLVTSKHPNGTESHVVERQFKTK